MVNSKKIKEFFLKDTKRHRMIILHDDGIYRHVRFQRPDSNIFQYDLITYPNYLVFSGDMGCYVFSRILDMFKFFRGDGINPSYWEEKCEAMDCHTKIREFSQDELRDYCRNEFNLYREGLEDDPSYTELWDEIEKDVISSETLEEAYNNISRFEYGDFQFDLDDPPNLTDFTYHYIWALWAIVDGIRQYDNYIG